MNMKAVQFLKYSVTKITIQQIKKATHYIKQESILVNNKTKLKENCWKWNKQYPSIFQPKDKKKFKD
jgi:hypothetical protein